MITTRHHPDIKYLFALSKKKGPEGLFLVEGEREISHVKDVEVIYYAEESDLIEEKRAQGIPVKKVDLEVLAQVTYREGEPLAVVRKFSYTQKELRGKKLLLLVEGVEKPGNLGAILRTAEGAGVEGIIFCDLKMDPFHPNVVRASLGAFFRLPFLILSVEEAHKFLEEESMQVVVASPHGEKPYFALDFQKPTCLVVGSEAYGVSPIWEKESLFVHIPMKGEIDSLNVSVATSILLYEVVRQRHADSLSR